LLDDQTAHHVEVDADAIAEVGGAATFSGVSGATAWNFTTGVVTKPGSVSNGLVLWLDADHAESIKTATDVRYWADRSGQHNDVANGTAAERPSRLADAIGNRAVVHFDGADDWLHATEGLNLTSAEGFLVWRSGAAPSTSTKRSLFVNGENLEVNHGHPFVPNSVVSCTSSPCEGSAYAAVVVTPGAAVDTTTLWHFGFDALTTSLFSGAQGGALSFQPAPTTPPVLPSSPLGIGGHDEACEATDGCWFEGDIAEVVLYSRRLTQAERLAVIDYLRSKWDVPEVACGGDESLGANGSCYFVQTTADDWTGARDSCTGRGAGWNLATVRSALDHDEVTGLLDAVTNAWIGGSDSDVPNTWRWVTDTLQFWNGTSASSGGTPSNGAFTLWRAGEPSSTADEGCARYNLSGEWAWADDVCTTAHASICEGPGN
jgi:hypothetical protein